MYWRLLQQALTWLPTALVGFVLAASAAFDEFRTWAVAAMIKALAASTSASFVVFTIAFVALYIAAIFYTARRARDESNPRAYLRAWVANTIFGGEVPNHPGMHVVLLDMEVTNDGELPSAIIPRSWRMQIGGRDAPSLPFIDPDIPMRFAGTYSFETTPENSLLRKSRTPIGTGEIMTGYIIGAASRDQIEEIRRGGVIRVSFQDARRRDTVVEHSLQKGEGTPYFTYGKMTNEPR